MCKLCPRKGSLAVEEHRLLFAKKVCNANRTVCQAEDHEIKSEQNGIVTEMVI